MTGLPIAFYAPLKSPDHPVPSGDRTMARLLMSALRHAGVEPFLASELRTYEPLGDEVRQRHLRDRSAAEADRLASHCASLRPDQRPRLWFTYHSYYKAPDYLGPLLAARLAIPYVIAEASRARRREAGPWAFAHRAAEAALDAASAVFVMTARDREALAAEAGSGQRLVDLPPFLAPRAWTRQSHSGSDRSGPVRLLSVGMMRDGDKLASYRLLADALRRIADLDWKLDVVGDGPARPDVEELLAPFCGRVRLHGEVGHEALTAIYADADILVWPAVNEAYGMVLLEAQAAGCPVVAGGYGGVASVMVPGLTGLMTPPRDVDAFAAALAQLIHQPENRRTMGRAAAAFVSGERNVESAGAILAEALSPLLARRVAAA